MVCKKPKAPMKKENPKHEKKESPKKEKKEHKNPKK